MLELERELISKLKEQHVRINVPDGNTVVLQNVPLSEAFFSKGTTNLLFKRPHPRLPFVIGVDEDLQYLGGDLLVNRVFDSGITREGWRMLLIQPHPRSDLQEVAENALAVLGFGRPEPVAQRPDAHLPKAGREGGLLDAAGTDLTQQVANPDAEPTVGRVEEVEAAVACLWRWGQARLPLIVGAHGVGKTNLLHAIARKLREAHPTHRLVALDLGTAFAGTMFDAEREGLFGDLLKEAAAKSGEVVLALEHFELAFIEVPHGPLQLAKHLDAGAKVIATTLPQALPGGRLGALERRLATIELAEPSPEESVEVLAALRRAIETHHHVEIAEGYLRPCVEAAYQKLPGCLPAKAIALLDAAAARAALGGSDVLGMDDLLTALHTWI
jgi:hypothetical protein